MRPLLDTKDDQEVDRNWWRTYDYTLIRNINQFLKGLRESTALSEVEKAPMEGEARFIRAWVYFCTLSYFRRNADCEAMKYMIILLVWTLLLFKFLVQQNLQCMIIL